jgi:alpha-L-rhamnosidase
MFGGAITWFYRELAGMKTDQLLPGYRNIIFKPRPAGDVSFVSYSNETTNGMAAVSWKKNSDTFKLDILVPVGSIATVYVPALNAKNVTESGKEINAKNGVSFQKMENGYAIFTVGSGEYSFDSHPMI